MNSTIVLSLGQEIRRKGLTNILSVKHDSFGIHPAGSFDVNYEHVGLYEMEPARVLDGYLFAILFFAMQTLH